MQLNIRPRRQELGLSQERLSMLCGVSQRTIDNMEKGSQSSFKNVCLVAKGLGVNPEELLTDQEDFVPINEIAYKKRLKKAEFIPPNEKLIVDRFLKQIFSRLEIMNALKETQEEFKQTKKELVETKNELKVAKQQLLKTESKLKLTESRFSQLENMYSKTIIMIEDHFRGEDK
jgi:transcriptional regulator with XRE-family HTH domain